MVIRCHSIVPKITLADLINRRFVLGSKLAVTRFACDPKRTFRATASQEEAQCFSLTGKYSMNDPSNSGGDGSGSPSDVNQAPGSDSTPSGDDDLLSVLVGPGSAHYYMPAFRRLAAKGGVEWNWPVFFATWPWLLYRKMWLYSIGYMIGVPILIEILMFVALIVNLSAGFPIFYITYTTYVVVVFILAPMFATRLYYAHARKKIGNVKSRALSIEEQRLEVARAGGVSTIAAVLLPLIMCGFLLAIAVGGVNDMTVRAQVSEGLNLAGGVKAAVAEYYQETRQFPSDNAAAGLSPATDIQGKYVSSVRVEAGEVVVTFGNDADSDLSGHTLVMRPEVTDEGVEFVCSSLDIADKHLPAYCR